MIWNYSGKPVKVIEDMPEGTLGFVYKITNIKTGKFYIGRKVTVNRKKTRIGVREKAKTKTRKTFKVVIKESNWKSYTGSCKELNEDIAKYGESAFTKEILEYCCGRKYLNFAELEYQIKYEVLRVNSYNGNVAGKYYRKDMENC